MDWSEKKITKYSDIKEIMKKLKKENIENIIFVNGNKNYVDIINKNIDKYLENLEKHVKSKETNKKN